MKPINKRKSEPVEVDPLCFSLGPMSMRLENPKLLAGPSPAIQFAMSFLSKGKKVLIFPGWRVWRGKVTAPARKAGSSWISVAIIESPEWEAALAKYLCEWEELFPTVTFPSRFERSEDEIPPEEFDEDEYSRQGALQ